MRTTIHSEPAFFVGRASFLQELHELLQSTRRVAISAPAGVGKTAVAAAYVRRFAQVYEQVFYLRMTSMAGWLADSLELAERLALAVSAEEPYPAGFNQVLQSWLTQHPQALLIIDDVGSVAFPAVQEQTVAHVLFLTRKPVDDPSIAHLALPALEAGEGALLLLRQSGFLSADASLEQADAQTAATARTLADELAGLPLALHLAGANMRVSGRSAQEFLSLYRQYVERLVLLKASRDKATDALAITCSLPARRLHQTHQVAAALLWLCAVLAPLPIPRALFLRGASELTPDLQALADNPALLDEALAQLSALGLLLSDAEDQSVSLQMTVQETLCRAQAEEVRNSLVAHALRAFIHVLPTLEEAAPAARLRVAAQILHLAGANMRVSGRSAQEFLSLYRQYVERLVLLKASR
ncbi:MAG TPA: ATP-binding protein, partial [Ktedonobacteraceae bacterium]|nr:ATP-binding protein [Ktedonobacteraceae bacterium]